MEVAIDKNGIDVTFVNWDAKDINQYLTYMIMAKRKFLNITLPKNCLWNVLSHIK